FSSAARAMFEIIADLSNVSEKESREVELTSAEPDTLLVDWLNELLYLFDAEQLLLCRFDVLILPGEALRATVYGERVDPARHLVKMGIKAATYHMLELKCEPAGCEARVIFDV
ncbi:MAG TPA: archease, partial [Chloroflexota bacterium]|nr:archease [Chloroflexota bacterium]